MTFTPNRISQKRAKVFGGAHERVVRTDRTLSRTRQDLSNSRDETKRWKDFFSDPIMQAFGEQIQKDLSRLMSETISEDLTELLKNDKELRKIFLYESLDRMVKETGDNLAAIVRDHLLPEAEIYVDAYQDAMRGTKTVETCVYVPARKVHARRSY